MANLMVLCGNIVGKTYRYFSVALLGEIIACVYENQEVDAYLFMAVPDMLGQEDQWSSRTEHKSHARRLLTQASFKVKLPQGGQHVFRAV